MPLIPALGSRRFTLEPGKAKTAGGVTVAGNTIENSKLRIVINPRDGSIMSLKGKSIGDEDLVDSGQQYGINDYLYTIGRKTGEGYSRITTPVNITIEDAGPVVGTIKVETAAPGCNRLVRRIRVYAETEYIELFNELDKARQLKPEGVYFAFPFDVPDGEVRIDIPFGVVRPGKDQLPGANFNYYSVQRWVDVSNDDYGVTWVTLDAPMLKFHPFKIIGRGRGCLPAASFMYDKPPEGVPDFWLDEISPTPFFYSWVMTNHWECNYKAYQEGMITFRYVLRPHKGQYDSEREQKFARGICQPLLAIRVDTGTPVAKPLLEVEGDGVIVNSIRPSRDGKAFIIRLFNTAEETQKIRLKWNRSVRTTWISNPMEDKLRKAPSQIQLGRYEVVTLKTEL